MFSYTSYENAENNKNNNTFTEFTMYNSSWTWTNTLTYNNTWGKHNLKVLAGTEAIQNYQRGFFGQRNNYPLTNAGNLTVSPNLWSLLFGPPSGQVTGQPEYQ